MKNTMYIFPVIVAIFLAFYSLGAEGGSAKAKRKPLLDTEMKKISYALGQQIGDNLKSQFLAGQAGDKMDIKSFSAAIDDALNGRKSLISPVETQTLLKNWQTMQMKAQEEASKNNLRAAADYLTANKSKKGINITQSGLQYEVIKMGQGEKPKATDKVTVHYRGTLIDGSEFDSSYKRNDPVTFGLNQVIKGWTEGLQLMPVGSKFKFYIPPTLAYGKIARPGIPANSLLIFDVELIEIAK